MGVGSSDWESHLNHNREFLSIMRRIGMTLNLAKCEFGKPEVKFVGRLVGSGTHRADPQHLEGIALRKNFGNYSGLLAIIGSTSHTLLKLPSLSQT